MQHYALNDVLSAKSIIGLFNIKLLNYLYYISALNVIWSPKKLNKPTHPPTHTQPI